MQCAYSTNLTKNDARSPRSAHSLPNDCSSAAYVWNRCPIIRSLVLNPADICSAANACADTSPCASMNIDSLYYVLLALRVKGREKGRPAVRVASGWSPIIASCYVSLRGLAVPCPGPWAHRPAMQYLDRDGNGYFLCSLILSEVSPSCLPLLC